MPHLLVHAHHLHPGTLYFSLVNGLPVPQRDVFAHWRVWAFAHAVSTPCHSLPPGPPGDSSIILQPQVYFPKSLGSHLSPREHLTTLYSPISLHPCSHQYPGDALRVPSKSLIFTSLRPKKHPANVCWMNHWASTLSHGFQMNRQLTTSKSLSWFTSSWAKSWLILLCDLGKVTFSESWVVHL